MRLLHEDLVEQDRANRAKDGTVDFASFSFTLEACDIRDDAQSFAYLFACGMLAAVAGYLYAYPLVAKAPQEAPLKGERSTSSQPSIVTVSPATTRS